MKSALKKTSFYLVLGFLPLASNFLLAPLFTRFLSPIEYGLIALCTLVQHYLNIFIDLGLKGSFSRYYFRYFRNPAILKTLFSTVVIAIVCTTITLYIFFYFFGDVLFGLVFKNDLFTFDRYGHFICALTLAALLNSVILTYFRNEENLKRYALISLGTFFLMAIGALAGVVIWQYGAYGNLAGKVAGAGLVVSLFFTLFFIKNGIRFEIRLLRPLLKYGLPLIPFGILNVTILNLDRFFIERYFDLNVLGEYNIAFLISTIPFIMLNSFQSSVNPSVIKLLETTKDDNREANYREINSNFKIMLLFMGIMIWGMITLSGFFTKFYVGPEYRGIIFYLPILMIAFVPLVYQNMFSLLLFYNYNSKILPVISLVTLAVAVVLNVVLISWYGIYGVALAVLGKNLLFAFATYWVVKRKGYYNRELFRLEKYNWLTVLIVISGIISLFLIHIFPDYYQWVTLVTGGLIGVFIFALFKTQFSQLIVFVRGKFSI